MADLIIKPNSATGDKLILQDRAGGAVLTTADSGIASIKLAPGSAPGSPAEGAIYYDSTNGVLQVYDGSVWKIITQSVNKLTNKITATGGTIVTSGAYKYHTFTSSGNFVVSAGAGTVEFILVAGGGSGSVDGGGGGGAGGLIGAQVVSVTAQTYAIVIGAGAAGRSGYNGQPANGSNSTGFSLTAQGGGGGNYITQSGYIVQQDLPTGGSGGGAMWTNNGTNQPLIGGQGTSGQGHIGGSVVGTSGMSWEGAGGGGAGERGGDINQNKGGPGGAGRPFQDWAAATSTGESGYYAGGGGGANESGAYGGAGGLGGGGRGGHTGDQNGYNGDANTGGGGGGGDSLQAGAGGSGIAIIRYLV